MRGRDWVVVVACLLALLLLHTDALGKHGRCDHHTARYTGCKAGHSLYYVDREFERIGRVRIRQGYITHIRRDVAGYTAVTDCSQIGRIAHISLNGGRSERYQILDCSHPSDVANHVAVRRVAEVDASSFVRNGCGVWLKNGYVSAGRCSAVLHSITK